MSASRRRVLVIGYGNPGRLDDGLGPALAAWLEELALRDVTVEANYQLSVEDGAQAAEHDVVIFADAALRGSEPFFFRRLRVPEKAELGFSTHSVEPAGVMAVAHKLFGARTTGYVLGIRGYAFDRFGEELSEQARANLAAATAFLEGVLRSGVFDEVGAAPEDAVELSDANGV
ncbi:MAG: hydrogenase maturation protease [Phycisphaerae bacterium]|jgi:hydrogenase maturation protease